MCGGVEVWRCGGVEVWRCGGVEVWRCGGVEVWRCGGVEVCLGRLVSAFSSELSGRPIPPRQEMERLVFGAKGLSA